MTDYILIRKGRNLLTSVLHVVFNVALGVGSVFLTVATGHWAIGLILVLLSKWRMFAVRSRYRFLNLKSNLVDLIVGISFVFLAYCYGTTLLPVHLVLAAGYCLWLLWIKPRSSGPATALQAMIAIFLGSTAAVLLTASASSIWLCLACFIIGYAASRHVLVQSDDHDFTLITLIAGLLMAEIAWISHGWLIVYMFNDAGILVPQLSLILCICSWLLGRSYRSIVLSDGEFHASELAMPTIFCVLLIFIVIIWFSQPIFNV